jgi:hypothetical protein
MSIINNTFLPRTFDGATPNHNPAPITRQHSSHFWTLVLRKRRIRTQKKTGPSR